MTVVTRVLDGRTYIHARRKVKGEAKQIFINIDGLTAKKIDAAYSKAIKFDRNLELEQNSNSLINSQLNSGRLMNISIRPPDKKNGWNVALNIKKGDKNRLCTSYSIEKYGVELAVNLAIQRLLTYLEIKQDSTHWTVMTYLYKMQLSQEYNDKSKKLRTYDTVN